MPIVARVDLGALPSIDIDRLEAAILRHEQIPIEPVHRFADGIYAREITIPAGAILTGKIHRTRHLNIISRGDISVWSAGEPVRRIRAPYAFVAEAGARRVGVAHEETVWTTVHGTALTDLAALEAALIEPHDNPLHALLATTEVVCLG